MDEYEVRTSHMSGTEQVVPHGRRKTGDIMRTATLGRVLAATVLTVGSVLAIPAVSGSSPAPLVETQLPTQLPALSCDVGGQADLVPPKALYAASYRHCTVPGAVPGSPPQYSSWLATTPASMTGCNPAGPIVLTGSANLYWVNRNDTFENGTADYTITLNLNNPSNGANLVINVKKGPYAGYSINAIVALTTDSPMTCPDGTQSFARVFIDGPPDSVNFFKSS
ncbi:MULTISPECIES: hypothetical protein [unclassified Nocardia]|uniref:hypothetical protein n=1 Tax=unclassified Nocardia TaxID=2637762 RepID=UPI001CE47DF3|nr:MULTISPECIES: hypothetical protein [unclassified Nocardia]